MTCVVGDSFGGSLNKLTTRTRHFEQAPQVDRPPPTPCFDPEALPATQGQRWQDGKQHEEKLRQDLEIPRAVQRYYDFACLSCERRVMAGMRHAAMLELEQASSSNAYVAFTVFQYDNCVPGVR
jgi:hypothetical protein